MPAFNLVLKLIICYSKIIYWKNLLRKTAHVGETLRELLAIMWLESSAGKGQINEISLADFVYLRHEKL